MGQDNRTNGISQISNSATIIPKGTVVTGGINTTGDINIYGEINGVIINANLVLVGKTGKVTGVIKAKRIIAAGTIDAKIVCEELEVYAQAKVIGEVEYKNIDIEKGSIFKAQAQKVDFEYESEYLSSTKAIQKVLQNPWILDKIK